MAVALLLLCLLSPMSSIGQLDPTAHADVCRRLCEAAELSPANVDSSIASLNTCIQLLADEPPSLTLAELYYRLGKLEAMAGDLETGLRHLEYGDSLAHQLCPEGCLEAAQSAHELGKYYWFRDHNLRLARQYLVGSLEMFLNVQHDDTVTMSTTMLYLGYSSRDLGEVSRAKELLQQALEIRKRHYPANSAWVLIVYHALANLHFNNDEYPEAKQICEEGIRSILSSGDEDDIYLGSFRNTLAVTLIELGECDEALEVYAANLQQLSKSNDLNSIYMIALNHLNTAQVYERTGSYQTATTYFSKAAKLLENKPRFRTLAAQVQYHFSEAFLVQASYDSALFHMQSAIQLLSPGRDIADIHDLPSAEEAEAYFELKEHLAMKAEVLLAGVKAGHWPPEYLDLALRCFDLAIRSLDAVWLEFDDPGDKLAFSSNGANLYEQAISAAFARWSSSADPAYLGKMHDYIERSKSQLMQETMRRARAAYLAGIPQDRVEQHQALRATVTELNERLSKAAQDKDSVAAINQRLLMARNEYTASSKQLAQDYPRYSELVGQRSPKTLENLQTFYQDPAELLIEYYLSDTAIYIISVHQGKSHLRTGVLDRSFTDGVKAFMQVVGSPGQTPAQIKRFQTAAQGLYKLLLKPEIDAAGPSVKRLRIVPDRQLSAFPFEALLVSEQAPARSFAGLDYAIQHFQISYASSATLLLEANALPDQVEPYEVLGLAWASAEADATENRFPEPGEKFSNIPGTAEEIRLIEQIAQGRYLMGQAASERKFKELAPDYGLIHIALHGRASDGEPFLAFPSAGKGEDGILYLEELYQLSLRARLTVLSACETGKGVVQKGEGVMSMARGFGIAGAPSTVMSLWEVDDQVSAEIMGAFYVGLSDGKPIDASLRDAKLAHLAKSDPYTSSPFYWATYIPVGANAPIQLKLKSTYWPYVVVAGITICFLVFVIFIRRWRKLSA